MVNETIDTGPNGGKQERIDGSISTFFRVLGVMFFVFLVWLAIFVGHSGRITEWTQQYGFLKNIFGEGASHDHYASLLIAQDKISNLASTQKMLEDTLVKFKEIGVSTGRQCSNTSKAVGREGRALSHQVHALNERAESMHQICRNLESLLDERNRVVKQK